MRDVSCDAHENNFNCILALPFLVIKALTHTFLAIFSHAIKSNRSSFIPLAPVRFTVKYAAVPMPKMVKVSQSRTQKKWLSLANIRRGKEKLRKSNETANGQ